MRSAECYRTDLDQTARINISSVCALSWLDRSQLEVAQTSTWSWDVMWRLQLDGRQAVPTPRLNVTDYDVCVGVWRRPHNMWFGSGLPSWLTSFLLGRAGWDGSGQSLPSLLLSCYGEIWAGFRSLCVTRAVSTHAFIVVIFTGRFTEIFPWYKKNKKNRHGR